MSTHTADTRAPFDDRVRFLVELVAVLSAGLALVAGLLFGSLLVPPTRHP